MGYTSSVDRFFARPITTFPEDDARYALFAYLQQLADLAGADRLTYVTLQTEYKTLKEMLNPEYIALTDGYSQTALHLAAQYCTIDDLALILDHNAPVDAGDDLGYTPLFYAAIANNVATAQTLLGRGEADITATGTQCQRNVLHVAVMFGSKEVIDLLLDTVSRHSNVKYVKYV